MTIQEAYLRSLQKNEQNLANGGIKLDPGRFVLLFNEAQDRLIRYYLNRKDDETIRSIQTLWYTGNRLRRLVILMIPNRHHSVFLMIIYGSQI